MLIAFRCCGPVGSKATIDARDAFAKSLYGKLFDWLVIKINHTLGLSLLDWHSVLPWRC